MNFFGIKIKNLENKYNLKLIIIFFFLYIFYKNVKGFFINVYLKFFLFNLY